MALLAAHFNTESVSYTFWDFGHRQYLSRETSVLNTCKEQTNEREKERDRQTETETDRDRPTETETHRGRQTDRGTEREREAVASRQHGKINPHSPS